MPTPHCNPTRNTPHVLSRTSRSAPANVSCAALPDFDLSGFDSLRRAFSTMAQCNLTQAWLEKEDPGFAPGIVRIGWRKTSLMILAELRDADIFNSATRLNQRIWELGDTFEIFLQPEDAERYVEFQVSPDNQQLQLCYPNIHAVASARRSGNLTEFLIWNDAFKSRTWITKSAWKVYAEIPAASVCGRNASLENTRWRFSFCRYDYTRGVKEPVISSTSPHAKPDFHRQGEWGWLTFDR